MDDKKDKRLIIFSIIVAIIMWGFVMTTTNPFLTKTIRNVPMTIRNLENIQNQGYELVGKDQIDSVNVKVEASRSDMMALDSRDLVASVDLQSPSEGIRSLNINVDSPSGVKVVDIEPKKINLRIEKVIEKDMAPQLDLDEELKNDRIVEINEIYPDKVTIKGIRSQIEKVDQVRVRVDDESYLDGKIHNIDLEPLDKDGNVVDNISLSDKQVSISFKVSETKEVGVNLKTKGDVDEDYEVKSTDLAPEKIILKGDNEVLADIEEIETEVLDIEGAKANMEGTIKLALPDNVEIYDGNEEVSYTVSLKKLEKKEKDKDKD